MKIGISIYPERSTFERDKEYLDSAQKLGFKRVFTSLLEITGDGDHVINNFKRTVLYASEIGMEVIVDINPAILKQIGVSFDDLAFFNELGAYGVRLDRGFTGIEEAAMTRNPYGIKLEVNLSIGNSYINNVMAFSPNINNLLGSHNFYPMRYTGLSEEYADLCLKNAKSHNLETTVFITSQTGNLGPWIVQDGLVTMEMHRDLSIATQMRHMMMNGFVDTVVIGNSYATIEELTQVAKIRDEVCTCLTINLAKGVTDIEKTITLEETHSYRGDVSGYMMRSSLPRFKYKKSDIAVNNCNRIQPGDVLIGNNNLGQYKGELHVALKEMENYERLNVVGHLTEESMVLLNYVKPWSRFKIVIE